MADELVGRRIELLAMPDDPCPIEIGEKGTITHVNEVVGLGATQISVDWDSGRSLMLSIPPDRYRIIE